MTLFQYISENFERVKYEVSRGLHSCTLLSHYEVYARFDSYKKQGHGYHKAFLFVLYDYDLSEMTVYRIIKKMESEM